MALQTKLYSHGSVTDKTVLNGYVLELIVAEQATSVANNTSTVKFALKLRSGSKNRFNLYGLGASVSLDGKEVGSRNREEAAQVSLEYNASVTLVSGSTTIAHNVDGTKTMDVAFSIDMKSGDYTPGPVSVTGNTMELTAIPRASTVAAADANIGAVSTIVVDRKSTDFTHTIGVSFGNSTGYLDEAGVFGTGAVKMKKTIVAFQVPDSFYTQIPQKTSGTCTITCNTYSGTTLIGSNKATCTLTAAQSVCAPTVSIAVKDVSSEAVALTGDNTKLIRYVSTARCTVSATAKNKASVQSVTVNGVAVSGTTVDFSATEENSFTALCQDSRGYRQKAIATATMIPYVKFSCNASAKRTTATGSTARLTLKGNFYSGSFGAKSNSLTLTYKLGGNAAVTLTPTISGNTYTAAVNISDLDYTQSYSLTVTAKDAVCTITKTVTIQPGVPVFDWGQGDFAFHVPVSIQGNPIVDFIIEKGTSGIWRYRKWASGNVECWGRVDTTVPDTLTQSGSIYWSTPLRFAYPFTITDAYRYTTTANAGIVCAQITGTSSEEFAFRLNCSKESLAGSEAVVFLYVKGRWK